MKLSGDDLICKMVCFNNKYHCYMVLPSDSFDPIVNIYLDGNASNDYMLKALELTTKPGDLVLDLGCHVGTFSLGASAMGRSVIAVDANQNHVEWVRKAGLINEFRHLLTLQRAISLQAEPVRFLPNGLVGSIDYSNSGSRHVEVKTIRVDDVVKDFAQGRPISFVKMDVEGAEHDAIRSAFDLLRSHQPIIWFESNAGTFEKAGSSVLAFRTDLEGRGYRVYRIEGDEWVYAPPDQFQPELWVDMIALGRQDQAKWSKQIRHSWSDDEIVACCDYWSKLPYEETKTYLAREIAGLSGAYPLKPRLEQIIRAMGTV